MRKRDDATAERVLRRSRIEAGWHPGIELAVMSVRPDLPDAIKTVILKVLLENTVVSDHVHPGTVSWLCKKAATA